MLLCRAFPRRHMYQSQLPSPPIPTEKKKKKQTMRAAPASPPPCNARNNTIGYQHRLHAPIRAVSLRRPISYRRNNPNPIINKNHITTHLSSASCTVPGCACGLRPPCPPCPAPIPCPPLAAGNPPGGAPPSKLLLRLPLTLLPPCCCCC